MDDWKSKVMFVAPEGVEVEIGEKTFKFYPISVKAAFKLRLLAKPLVAALATLFAPNDTDTGKKVRELGQGARETVIEALTTELASLRSDQRERSIQHLVDTLTDPATLTVVGSLLADSLRDVFPRDAKESEISKWIAEQDLAIVVDLVKGLAKGNERVFGPLGSQVASAAKKALGDLNTQSGTGSAPPPAQSRSEIRPLEPSSRSTTQPLPVG